MPSNPLFSTYRAGENRVTASMLAVFERIDFGIVEGLLAAAAGESALPFVSFANQVAGQGSVPDAAISASFRYLFEVKTESGALRRDQLTNHLAALDRSFANERVFVVTPDAEEPEMIEELRDERLVWFSFRTLGQAISDLLQDTSELIAEQARFLLHELHELFVEDGLLGGEDTVIVAARHAYSDYLRTSAYVCQAGRSFRSGIERFGFYKRGEIRREIPIIRDRRDNVVFSPENASKLRATGDDVDAEIAAVMQGLIEPDRRASGEAYQVFLLSPPDDERTWTLERSIRNTKTDHRGQPWAWTLSQSYVRFETLQAGPETTGELDEAQRA